MSEEKTIHSEEEGIISSGMQEATEREAGGVISSGVTLAESEVVLKGKRYRLIDRLAASGEAETFLVEHAGDRFVLKIYYPAFQPKHEIAEYIQGIRHPDIVALIDCGWYQGRFYEVMEYAAGGTLSEVLPIRDPQRLREIVREVVNALHFCHERGVIHRDIKPSNIFFRDRERRDIVVGDFGISSVLEEGFSKKLTGQARTLVYAPPEVFQSIRGKTVVDRSVDYYALGITLIHLWTGREPFEGLGEYGTMRMKMEGRVEIPEDLPREFQTLIKGLITVNPAHRWGYDDVQRWLRGEEVPVYSEVHKEYPPFVFSMKGGQEIVAIDPASLADLMERDPELGKRHLYRKAISKWLEPVNQFLYSAIETIVEEEYPRDQEAGLVKAIYILDPNRPFRGVDGGQYGTPEEIASHLEEHFLHYKKELKQPTAALYLYLEARGYKQEADKFRKLFAVPDSTKLALNTLILSLEGGDILRIGSYRFQRPEELLEVDEAIKQQLVDDLRDPYSKLSLWLQQFPELKDSIEKWRSLKRFDITTFRYAIKGGFLWRST